MLISRRVLLVVSAAGSLLPLKALADPVFPTGMLLYTQRLGNLYVVDLLGKPVKLIANNGYSGNGAGKNDPDMQCLQDNGPIPQGLWNIVGVFNKNPDKAPTDFALKLSPDPTTDVCGRTNFWIHGDRNENPPFDPQSASEGCIIYPRNIRELIWNNQDKFDTKLRVVADEP